MNGILPCKYIQTIIRVGKILSDNVFHNRSDRGANKTKHRRKGVAEEHGLLNATSCGSVSSLGPRDDRLEQRTSDDKAKAAGGDEGQDKPESETCVSNRGVEEVTRQR